MTNSSNAKIYFFNDITTQTGKAATVLSTILDPDSEDRQHWKSLK